MIVLRWKPLEKIRSFVAEANRLLLVDCRGCATVCSAGGEKETEEMARLLELAAQREGRKIEIGKTTIERQCDREIDAAVACAWQLIVERVEAQGRLGDYEKIIEPADWSPGRDGGPRRLAREDLT